MLSLNAVHNNAKGNLIYETKQDEDVGLDKLKRLIASQFCGELAGEDVKV